MSDLTLNEYQQKAARTLEAGTQSASLSVLALGLAGESGEVADLVKKHIGHGHHLDMTKLAKELGDCLWYISGIAKHFNIHLSAIGEANIEKLLKRYPDGFSSEASINRVDDPE